MLTLKVKAGAGARAGRRAAKAGEKALAEYGRLIDEASGALSFGINPNLKYHKGRKKPVRVASVFLWNEFGTGRVPERPAVRTMWKQKKDSYNRGLAAHLGRHLSPKVKTGSWESQISALGRRILKDIRKAIYAWQIPKNAPSTERRKGFNNPLIHTRKMIKSWEFQWSPKYSGGGPAKKAFRDMGKAMDRALKAMNKVGK